MKAKILEEPSYTIVINDIRISGFVKGDSFHGITEYRHPSYGALLLDSEPGPNFQKILGSDGGHEEADVVKISPPLINSFGLLEGQQKVEK